MISVEEIKAATNRTDTNTHTHTHTHTHARTHTHAHTLLSQHPSPNISLEMLNVLLNASQHELCVFLCVCVYYHKAS